MPPLYPLIQHPLRQRREKKSWETWQSQKAHIQSILDKSPRNSRLDSACSEADAQKSERPWWLQRERRRERGACTRYDDIIATLLWDLPYPHSPMKRSRASYTEGSSLWFPTDNSAQQPSASKKKKKFKILSIMLFSSIQRGHSDSCNIDETRNHYTK